MSSLTSILEQHILKRRQKHSLFAAEESLEPRNIWFGSIRES